MNVHSEPNICKLNGHTLSANYTKLSLIYFIFAKSTNNKNTFLRLLHWNMTQNATFLKHPAVVF